MIRCDACFESFKPGTESGGNIDVSGVTGRSQCDFCRRSVCPLITGEGRPCRQYNQALEVWREKMRAQREQGSETPDKE